MISFNEALQKICDDPNRNYFVTGQAGTGKTRLIKSLYEKFLVKMIPVTVTSTTGVSSVNVGCGCTTVHSKLKIGLAKESASQLASNAKTRRVISQLNVLVIDEISLMSATTFRKLDELFRLVRRNDHPFGNVKLIVVGDFLQLPPVNDRFCFETDSWKNCRFEPIILVKIYRQHSDDKFMDLLGRMRLGRVTDRDVRLLCDGNGKSTNESGSCTQLYCKNISVDEINRRELGRLSKRIFTNEMVCVPESFRRKFEAIVPDKVSFVVGARVMLTINLDLENGLYNGVIGTVKSIDSITGDPVVRFFGSDRNVHVTKYEWELKDDDSVCCVTNTFSTSSSTSSISSLNANQQQQQNSRVVARCSQYPLKLAYALTVHKSQGCTLSDGIVDLENVFEFGQAYVAVSRFTDLKNVIVKNADRSSFRAHPSAIQFYQSLTLESIK